jgi:riboflavin synthase
MFTGIVEEAGEVVAAREEDGGRRLRVACDEVGEDLQHGQSISVSGVCLTVEEYGAHDADADAGATAWFETFLAAETVERTYLDAVAPGDRVNLERAMPADGRLDGHVVQGHVDCTTEVVDVREVGEREARSASDGPDGDHPSGGWTFEFTVPPGYGKYIPEKGSVALDGISLTVAERFEDTFTVAIIPTTHDLTNFRDKASGDPVHVEIDVLARYAERLLADRERAEVPVQGVDGSGVGVERGQ